MPGFDRTGPMGAGPRTGGGFGYCGRNANTAADRCFGAGGGFGRGRRSAINYGGGRGRGRRSRLRRTDFSTGNYPQPNPEQERAFLVDQIADLKADLNAMEERIGALDDGMSGNTKE